MGKHNSKKKADEKKVVRSAYSGRICNGRDVILTSEAVEYLKKIGYTVKLPKK